MMRRRLPIRLALGLCPGLESDYDSEDADGRRNVPDQVGHPAGAEVGEGRDAQCDHSHQYSGQVDGGGRVRPREGHDGWSPLVGIYELS